MRIAVLGCGAIGGTLARAWARAGHMLVLGSRAPDELGALAGELGACAARAEDAVRDADAVLLSVPLHAVPDLAQALGPALRGRTVLDATNPFLRRDGLHGRAAAEDPGGSGTWTARHLLGAHVVKAFNTIFHRTLATQGFRAGPALGVPLAGDDPCAVERAAGLVRDAGFAPVPLGPLATSRHFDPGTPLWNSGFDVHQVQALVAAHLRVVQAG